MKDAHILQAFSKEHLKSADTMPAGYVPAVSLTSQGGRPRAYGTKAFFAHLRQYLKDDIVESPFSKSPMPVKTVDLDHADKLFDEANVKLAEQDEAKAAGASEHEMEEDESEQEEKGETSENSNGEDQGEDQGEDDEDDDEEYKEDEDMKTTRRKSSKLAYKHSSVSAATSVGTHELVEEKMLNDDDGHAVKAAMIRCKTTGKLKVSLSWIGNGSLARAFVHDLLDAQKPAPGFEGRIAVSRLYGGQGRIYGSQAFFAHLLENFVAGEVKSPYVVRAVKCIKRSHLDEVHRWFAAHEGGSHKMPGAAAACSSSSSSSSPAAAACSSSSSSSSPAAAAGGNQPASDLPHPIAHSELEKLTARVYHFDGAYWVAMGSDLLRFMTNESQRKTTFGYCKKLCSRDQGNSDKCSFKLYQEELLAGAFGPDAAAFRSQHFTCNTERFDKCESLARKLLATIDDAKAKRIRG
jgi:hypothetical protein